MHVNGKMRLFETIPGIGRHEMQETGGGYELKYDKL
jgi:hypothetical protein